MNGIEGVITTSCVPKFNIVWLRERTTQREKERGQTEREEGRERKRKREKERERERERFAPGMILMLYLVFTFHTGKS